MRGLILFLLASLLVTSGSCLFAGEPPVAIEGTILVSGWEGSWDNRVGLAYFMAGTSDNITPAPLIFGEGDIAPSADQVAYTVGTGDWPTALIDVWKAGIDGSDPVNLTGPTELGGINCIPQWSPDGRQIAFQHCDPVVGLLPCVAGFHVWVIDADGSSAHKVTSEGSPATSMGSWSPNGYRLFCDMSGVGAITIDQDGTDLEVVPNVNGTDGDWSPDGSMIVSSRYLWDEVDGEPGVWRQLVLTDVHGDNERILVEQFLKDSEVEAHVADQGLDPNVYDWPNDVRWWVGPVWPEWAPLGNRIAFLAALPFDPDGPHYKLQDEIWIYDLQAEDLTKITDNDWHDNWLSWNGPNTFEDDPEVTVDNTTVEFSQVDKEGLTTIIRDDDPPELPIGYQFCEEFYEITTTAKVSGPITICMTYRDELVPSGSAEEDLAILHYIEDGGYWDDITTSRNPVDNIVCGQTDSLSVFTLSALRPARFPDVPATGSGPGGADPHWAFAAVEACAKAGIAAGYPDGYYRPTWTVTRAQMAVYVSRAVAGGEDAVPPGPDVDETTFPDVAADQWAYKYIEHAAANNIVLGYGDGKYHPEWSVSRGHMAVFIARAIVDPMGEEGMEGYEPTAGPGFDDVSPDYWSYKHIQYLAEKGVVLGYPDGKYQPTWRVTRDQMAVYIARAFELSM